MTTIQMIGEVIPNDYTDVYDYMGYDSFSPRRIKQELNDANGSDVVLEINSPGGYVDAGSEIYTALKEYPGKVTAKITGQACSAASWIALAADKVEMSPTAQMMIHRAATDAHGNSDDLSSALQAVDSMDRSFITLYAKRTGLDEQEIYRMMSQTTWMNAQEAVDKGFADEIMFDQQPAAVNAEGSIAIKPDMVSKIKNLLHKKQKSSSDDVKLTDKKQSDKEERSQLAKSKLALLFGGKNK